MASWVASSASSQCLRRHLQSAPSQFHTALPLFFPIINIAGDNVICLPPDWGPDKSSTELRDALTDPRLPVDRKKSIVEDLLGEKTSALSVNLVNFVVGVGMSSDLPAIADKLAERSAAERNKVIAEVRTAVELDDETIAKLGASLSKATGKDVEVKTVVDPSVVGGVYARVGDTVIDGSLSNRMQELRETLTRR